MGGGLFGQLDGLTDLMPNLDVSHYSSGPTCAEEQIPRIGNSSQFEIWHGQYGASIPNPAQASLDFGEQNDSALHHLANHAVSESLYLSRVTTQSDTQVPLQGQGSHLLQRKRSTSLEDVDCWNYSWAGTPIAYHFELINAGRNLPAFCLRILLAKNVEKRDGLILFGPSYFEEWLKVLPQDRPTPPLCLDESLLDAKTQLILLPASGPVLFAACRSALGTSPIYSYSFASITDFHVMQDAALRFFEWAFQCPHTSLSFRQLDCPTPRTSADAQFHLILSAVAVAELHSIGQLPRSITEGQNPNDILSFRQRAAAQLTSDSSSIPRPIVSVVQPKRYPAHSKENRSFRFVKFDDGPQNKRQKLEGEKPRRSGPLSETSLAESKAVRKRGGACERCKKLKKKCDGNEPCDQCKKRKKTSEKWGGPCVRGRSNAAKEMEHCEEDEQEFDESHAGQMHTPFRIIWEVLDSQEEPGTGAASTQGMKIVRVARSTPPEEHLKYLFEDFTKALKEILENDVEEDDGNVERIVRSILAVKPHTSFGNSTGALALNASVQINNIELASLLLEHGPVSFRTIGSWDLTYATYAAARNGRIEFIRLFLQHGASVTTPSDKEGMCPLHFSIAHGHTETSKLLVEHIMTLEDDDLQTAGWTQLHKAIMNGDEVEVRKILKAEDGLTVEAVHSKDCAGWTVLMWAAGKGDLAIFKLLVDAGAELGAKHELLYSGIYNTLHFAARCGSSSVVRYVYKFDKAMLHERDNDRGRSALHCGAKSNSTKTVQMLIDAGLSVNDVDTWEKSPLYYALEAGSASVASLLLRQGAEPQSVEMKFLLRKAAEKGLAGVIYTLLEYQRSAEDCNDIPEALAWGLAGAAKGREVECVRILLKNGADRNVPRRHRDDTPIHVAACSGSVNIVKLLLQSRSGHSDVKGRYDESARAIALQKKFFCIAALLGYNGDNEGCLCRCCRGLEQELDLQSMDEIGSPLEMAEKLFRSAKIGDVDMVRRLVRLGAPVSYTFDGSTALHVAVREGVEDIVALLLDGGADYDAVDRFRYTPLHDAAARGMISTIIALLAAGSNVNAGTRKKSTALMLATAEGTVECVKVLLKEDDVDVNILDENGNSALYFAIEIGSQEVIDRFLSVPQIDHDSPSGAMTPLQKAIDVGNRGALEALVRAGANPNKTGWGPYGNPLSMAVRKDDSSLITALTSSPGIDINAQDPNTGRTALIEASLYSRENHVSLLLKHPGINVNIADANGRTALMEASVYHLGRFWSDEVLILSLLLEKADIDVNFRDCKGRTALMEASGSGNREKVSLLLKYSGININIADVNGRTALMEASVSHFGPSSWSHRGTILSLLLEKADIDVNFRDCNGRTALMEASRSGSEERVSLLLKHSGIKINLADVNGRTALIEASAPNYIEVMSLLLQRAEIDVNRKDTYGRSALSVAIGCGDKVMANALLKHPDIDTEVYGLSWL